MCKCGLNILVEDTSTWLHWLGIEPRISGLEDDHSPTDPCSNTVMVCVSVCVGVSAHGMGNLHIGESTINAARYTVYRFLSNIILLPSEDGLFQQCPCLYCISKTMIGHFLHV